MRPHRRARHKRGTRRGTSVAQDVAQELCICAKGDSASKRKFFGGLCRHEASTSRGAKSMAHRHSAHRLPPFKSIEAFVVAARALSFTEAAATLHLTVPAISRRIQVLESELGVMLFDRTHRTLRLTDAGEAYLARLAPAVDAIRRASDAVREDARGQSLKVTLPASLA